MANTTYTVKKGDTLTAIAKKYNTTVKKLAALNDIDAPYRIHVGQKLTISGTAPKKSKVIGSKVRIKQFGLQSNTDRTVFVTWQYDRQHVDSYKVKWYYATGDGIRFPGDDTTTTSKVSIYNAPSNAKTVIFKVKPVSKKHKVKKTTKNKNGKKVTKTVEQSYWTGDWSSEKKYSFTEMPTTPSAPSVTIDNTFKLTASLQNLTGIGDEIEFEVVKDNASTVKKGTAKIATKSASFSWYIDAGGSYKARARSVKDSLKSEWSEYSSEVKTVPSAPKSIQKLYATSSTSAYIQWEQSSTADNYEIQYTTKKDYFDSSTEVKTVTVEKIVNHAEITGIESGSEYFFRVRATNSQGNSGWCYAANSLIIGKKPAAPTTWSSTTTCIIGEPLVLYWVHNTEDNSSQTLANLELITNGSTKQYTINGNGEYKIDASGNLSTITSYTSDDDKFKTTAVNVDASAYEEGATLQWRVRTAGVTKEYGDWSVQRTIDIYAPPTLELRLTDQEDRDIDVVESFPFFISGLAGPNTQTPIGYSVSITANEGHDTVDELGNETYISEGQTVYSKYIDTSSQLLLILSAENIDLENNISYTLKVVVAMNSGLTAEEEMVFTVSWEEKEYEPDGEIIYNDDTYTTSIRPYCEYYPVAYYKVTYDSTTEFYVRTGDVVTVTEGNPIDDSVTEDGYQVYLTTDENGNQLYYIIGESETPELVEDVTLSVYRKEFDGQFTKIASGVENSNSTYISDPHPSLDYARYRIIATTISTGSVSYTDIYYPIGEDGVIVQWDENWSSFETSSVVEGETDVQAEPPWTGSLLYLLYNVDVSDSNKPDVSLVEYIGRKYPVSYYGTQLGSTSTWNMEIPKDDEETLYGLRRLAIWMGDVYVREPSGSGYWANVTVSFSQKHCELTIPVTLSITRVEGGV